MCIAKQRYDDILAVTQNPNITARYDTAFKDAERAAGNAKVRTVRTRDRRAVVGLASYLSDPLGKNNVPGP